jgi:uncharacterized protein
MQKKKPDFTGVGIGLRSCHYSFIETEYPKIPWFEVVSDNYLCDGGRSLAHLEKICASYPITLHGVGMSLGSTDPININYLKKLKSLIKRTEPLLVSDHLSWSSFEGRYFHELLPLPYTEEAVRHLAHRIKVVQDYLELQFMIENVSSYLSFNHSTLTEWDFLQAISEEADCLILLDINNIYVSAQNNEFNPSVYLNELTTNRIAQFHLAGFEDKETHLLDSHSAAVYPSVWELYRQAINKFGPIPTCLEWDNHIPDFICLQEEANKAKKIMENYAHVA